MLRRLAPSHTGSVKRSKDQVSKNHTSAPAPGPPPFSLVWQIFPAIVQAAFLVRRPCLWQCVPHSRVKWELLDSLGGSVRGAVHDRLLAPCEQWVFWPDSVEICHSRKSATANLRWYFMASHGCLCGSRTITDHRQMLPALPETPRGGRAKQYLPRGYIEIAWWVGVWHRGSIRTVKDAKD